MEILTPGEKIKKLRRELGLKQEDIASDQISKSLISMIEKNKRGLTPKVAGIIADNLNQHYKKIGEEIKVEQLMETELDRVQKELYCEIDYLKNAVENAINIRLFDIRYKNIMATVNQWNLKKPKIELLVIRGEFYYNNYKYKEAIKDLSDALVYYIETKNYGLMAYIYNLIGTCYHMLMLVDHALIYYTKAYDIAIENDISIKEIKIHAIILNLILSYRKIERYDMALHYISVFKEIEKQHTKCPSYSVGIMLLEANTYRDLKNYKRAEKLYNKLLKAALNIDNSMLVVIHDNLSILYLQCDKIEKSLFYINKAFKLMGDTKPYDMLGVILTKANCEKRLGNTTNALKSLQEGVVIAEKISMNEMIINYRFALAELYITQKEYDNALKQLKTVEHIILKNNIKLKINELNSFYGQVYCLLGEAEKAVNYMIKIRQDYLAEKNE